MIMNEQIIHGIDSIRTDETGAVVSMSRFTEITESVEMDVADPTTGELKRMLVPGQKRIHRDGAWSAYDAENRVDPDDEKSEPDEAKVVASRMAALAHLGLDNDTAARAGREAALRDMLGELRTRAASIAAKRDRALAQVTTLQARVAELKAALAAAQA